MKTALILIIAAILLSTGMILWSTQQKVQRSDMVTTTCMTEVEPVRQMSTSQFFPSEKVHTVDVAVPVNVELDETFTGVELIGDTTLFKYIQVTVNDYRKAPGSISIKFRPLQEHGFNKEGNYFIRTWAGGDTLGRKRVAAANITARIGIGGPEPTDQRKRTFRFTGCPKIYSQTPITGSSIEWRANRVDSMWVGLNVDNFNFVTAHKAFIKLTGRADRANYKISGALLDGRELVSKEVYISGHGSTIQVFASEIFNAGNLSGAEVQLHGNPSFLKNPEVKSSVITKMK